MLFSDIDLVCWSTSNFKLPDRLRNKSRSKLNVWYFDVPMNWRVVNQIFIGHVFPIDSSFVDGLKMKSPECAKNRKISKHYSEADLNYRRRAKVLKKCFYFMLQQHNCDFFLTKDIDFLTISCSPPGNFRRCHSYNCLKIVVKSLLFFTIDWFSTLFVILL